MTHKIYELQFIRLGTLYVDLSNKASSTYKMDENVINEEFKFMRCIGKFTDWVKKEMLT
jgi:hypothetical protein